MRICVTYEDVRQAIDINPDDSVAKLKNAVNSKMIVDTTEDKKVGKYLELKFGGKRKAQIDFILRCAILHEYSIYVATWIQN